MGRRIEGYGAVFNSPSKMLGAEWDEVVLPGAITQETINNSVVLALMNHDAGRGVLARSKRGSGSLKLKVDNHGLHFSFEVPDTNLGSELLVGMERGDIDSCSFSFNVIQERWEKMGNGKYRRYIVKIGQLFDVSPVYNPAYEQTSISARSTEEGKKELRRWAELFKL